MLCVGNLQRLASRQVQRLPVATVDWASGRHRLRPSAPETGGYRDDINIPHYSRRCYLTRPDSNKSEDNLTCPLNSTKISRIDEAMYVHYDYDSYDIFGVGI